MQQPQGSCFQTGLLFLYLQHFFLSSTLPAKCWSYVASSALRSIKAEAWRAKKRVIGARSRSILNIHSAFCHQAKVPATVAVAICYFLWFSTRVWSLDCNKHCSFCTRLGVIRMAKKERREQNYKNQQGVPTEGINVSILRVIGVVGVRFLPRPRFLGSTSFFEAAARIVCEDDI